MGIGLYIIKQFWTTIGCFLYLEAHTSTEIWHVFPQPGHVQKQEKGMSIPERNDTGFLARLQNIIPGRETII